MSRRLFTSALLTLALVAGLVPFASTAGAVNIGHEGCTPGYWKNHVDNWQEVTPNTKLGTLGVKIAGWSFGTDNAAYGDWTILQALGAKGGAGISGATAILIRAGAAAWLNAAHEGVAYPYRRYATGLDGRKPLIDLLNAALTSGSRTKMLSLAMTLDHANNLGCPL
jgi:hypothetical protein